MIFGSQGTLTYADAIASRTPDLFQDSQQYGLQYDTWMVGLGASSKRAIKIIAVKQSILSQHLLQTIREAARSQKYFPSIRILSEFFVSGNKIFFHSMPH